MRLGILLGALIWLIIGCTVVAWSTDVRVYEAIDKDIYFKTNGKHEKAQADKKKTAP